MSDVHFPVFVDAEQSEDPKQRPGWRRQRMLIPRLLVALVAFGSAACEAKEPPEVLSNVAQAADAKAKKASEQAAQDLAAAEAAARQAAEDRAAAEAQATAAAEAKAAADKAAGDKAAAEKAAAEKAAADKAAADKAAAERAARERAAAEAAAQQQAAQIQPLAAQPKGGGNCTPEYPDFCIPPAADYDCPDFSEKNFTALAPDPYRLDGRDKDGIACET